MFELERVRAVRDERGADARAIPALAIVCAIGDVKDEARVREDPRAATRPRVVFHAAAYKHVPLMEKENAWAALQNNVLGTHVRRDAPRPRTASSASC